MCFGMVRILFCRERVKENPFLVPHPINSQYIRATVNISPCLEPFWPDPTKRHGRTRTSLRPSDAISLLKELPHDSRVRSKRFF